jgi:SagB-type dehydrogenase family enzyme
MKKFITTHYTSLILFPVLLAIPLVLLAGNITLTSLGLGLFRQQSSSVDLPSPKLSGDISVEEAISKRRSVRSYAERSLTLEQVSRLLWSAQGITDKRGFRAAPSAGALYPLELFVVAGGVRGLEPGVYRYHPEEHRLSLRKKGDVRRELGAFGQGWVAEAPAVIVFAGVYERTTGKYGERGVRYVHMEVGYAGENLFLQAEALGLGTVVVGAFHDNQVKKVLSLDEKEEPLAIMPVGYKE